MPPTGEQPAGRRPEPEAAPRSGGRRRRPDGDDVPPPPARPGGRRRRAEPEADADLPTEINRPDGNLLDAGAATRAVPDRPVPDRLVPSGSAGDRVVPGAPDPAEAPTQFLAPATEVIPRVRPDLDKPTERIAPKPAPPRPVVEQAAATALIPAVAAPEPEADDHEDEYDDFDEEVDAEPEAKPAPKQGKVATAIKVGGEAMVTLGMVMLLFVIYEVWITDLISAGKQSDVTSALDNQWNDPGAGDDPQRQQKFEFAEGEGMAKLYIPALGEDYKFTVVEGTTEADLEIGPGHYKNSALPGQQGNFAVAGHRVGKGAPFNDLDLLESCDAIVVETQTSWFVYRMLPTDADAKDWATTKAADPKCAGTDGATKVEPLHGEYTKATGRQIVTPQQSEVVAPVPGNTGSTLPKADRLKMITLTTCHPKFSNRERMILQGVLVREQPKTADHTVVPVELGETG